MSSQDVFKFYDVPGRKIIKSEGFGKCAPEDVRWAIGEVQRRAKSFAGKWAYIPVIEKLAPIIDPESQKLFAELHKVCEEGGCVALAFVAGGTAAIKVQAQRHQKASEAGTLVNEYFRTEEEALQWLKEEYGL